MNAEDWLVRQVGRASSIVELDELTVEALIKNSVTEKVEAAHRKRLVQLKAEWRTNGDGSMKEFEWRPINSVPIGVRVLLNWPELKHIECGKAFNEDEKTQYVLFDGDSLESPPSWWMPLPDEPELT